MGGPLTLVGRRKDLIYRGNLITPSVRRRGKIAVLTQKTKYEVKKYFQWRYFVVVLFFFSP